MDSMNNSELSQTTSISKIGEKEEESRLKVYIATSFVDKKEVAETARSMIVGAGHEVVSRWIDTVAEATDSPSTLREEALRNLEDILRCNVFVLFNDKCSPGKNVELGFAIAQLKRFIVVGERDNNVFLQLNCPRVDNMKELIDELAQWRPATFEVEAHTMSGAVRKK